MKLFFIALFTLSLQSCSLLFSPYGQEDDLQYATTDSSLVVYESVDSQNIRSTIPKQNYFLVKKNRDRKGCWYVYSDGTYVGVVCNAKFVYIGDKRPKGYTVFNGYHPIRISKKHTTIADSVAENYNYPTSNTIQTGPRGGNYYINSNGNKTYVKKKG